MYSLFRAKDTISLGMALDNLEAYSVVGVLERYEEFLYVLECLLPSYFSGIQKAYRGKPEGSFVLYN